MSKKQKRKAVKFLAHVGGLFLLGFLAVVVNPAQNRSYRDAFVAGAVTGGLMAGKFIYDELQTFYQA